MKTATPRTLHKCAAGDRLVSFGGVTYLLFSDGPNWRRQVKAVGLFFRRQQRRKPDLRATAPIVAKGGERVVDLLPR